MFRGFLGLHGSTISGRPDLNSARGNETLIVDVQAAQPRQDRQTQVMLNIMLLKQAGDLCREVTMSGQVYYGEGNTVDVPGGRRG